MSNVFLDHLVLLCCRWWRFPTMSSYSRIPLTQPLVSVRPGYRKKQTGGVWFCLLATLFVSQLLIAPMSQAVPGDENWDDPFGLPGANGAVLAMVSDNAGNVYVGGDFTHVDGLRVNHIAQWDGSSWSALGSGMNGIVDSLALDSNGELYAGGTFTTADGRSANRIAQ